MRPLARSEKSLFLILCGAVFIALNMLGLRAFLKARTDLQKSILSAQSQLAEDRNWILISEELGPAAAWIEAHPMPTMSRDEASAQLLKTERDTAEKVGLKISDENLLPPEDARYGTTVSVTAKLSGPFEGVARLLFALQKPTDWCTVQKLTLKSDAEPPNVIAELELLQYFRPSETGASPPNPAIP